jgi:catechol 2,3-dioxygenase-like lactoylglutathione lyase family enzyme
VKPPRLGDQRWVEPALFIKSIRCIPPAGAEGPGRNRMDLLVEDIAEEVDRLRAAGVPLLSDVVSGPGGKQVLVADPDGNLVELFEPAR